MKISVVIRCRNEEAHIARLLTGIWRQSRPADEVVMVDSGSTDATLSIASQFGVDVVHVDPYEFSFGRACNLGCNASSGDVIVFVSAHCYPIYDTWLKNLIAPLEADERIALAYGKQQVPPGGRFSEGRLMERWYPTASQLPQRHPFCNNANSVLRREVWEEIHFDESLTGLEDLDWAKRALAREHLLAYVAEAPVIHVHAESVGQVVNRYRREAIAHKQIYDEQTVSLIEAVRLAVTNIASDYLAAHSTGMLTGRHLYDIASFRIAQFYGTFRGFGQNGPVPGLLKRRFYYPDAPTQGNSASEPFDANANRIDYDAPIHPSEIVEVDR